SQRREVIDEIPILISRDTVRRPWNMIDGVGHRASESSRRGVAESSVKSTLPRLVLHGSHLRARPVPENVGQRLCVGLIHELGTEGDPAQSTGLAQAPDNWPWQSSQPPTIV